VFFCVTDSYVRELQKYFFDVVSLLLQTYDEKTSLISISNSSQIDISAMKVRLSVQHKKANVKTVVLHSDAVIGRSKDCNLRLASGQISRKHCQLLIDDERVAIRDLGSSNGTYLNGNKLEPNTETLLSTGDEISVGSVSFKVEYEDPAEKTQIRKKSDEDAAQEALKVSSADATDGSLDNQAQPEFQEAAEEDEASTGHDEIDVDEISDEELEALLAEEEFDQTDSSLQVELEGESSESQAEEAEETVTINPGDLPQSSEEFSDDDSDSSKRNPQQRDEPVEDEENEEDDDDDDDDENIMNFLHDLES